MVDVRFPNPTSLESDLLFEAQPRSAPRGERVRSGGADLTRKIILAAEEKDESFHSGKVILADEMIYSKGRFKRYWHAPKGGLWMTLALVNTLLPESSLLLPMAAGVACCEVLRHYGIVAHITVS